MAELDRVIGRSLTEALIRGEAQGCPRFLRNGAGPSPTSPSAARTTNSSISRHESVVHRREPWSTTECGSWTVSRPTSRSTMSCHLAEGASPSTHEFVGRLRADLRATSDIVAERELSSRSGAGLRAAVLMPATVVSTSALT